MRVTTSGANFSVATFRTITSWDHAGKLGYTFFDKVYTTTDDIAYTDRTLVARSTVGGAFTFVANTTNARIYMGCQTSNIDAVRHTLSTAGGGGIIVLEYWNGSSWTSVNEYIGGFLTTGVTDKQYLRSTSATTRYFVDPLYDWQKSIINGDNLYWLRYRVTTSYSTNPIFSLLLPQKSTNISKTLHIPETGNRTFKNVFAKLHLYNPSVSSLNKFAARGRIDSNNYLPYYRDWETDRKSVV